MLEEDHTMTSLAKEVGCSVERVHFYTKKHQDLHNRYIEKYDTRLVQLICAECGRKFKSKQSNAFLCSNKCKKKRHVRKYEENNGEGSYFKNVVKNQPSYKKFNLKQIQGNREKLRQMLFDIYGRKCACCGESHEDFLTLDHINRDGNKHRKKRKNDTYGVWRDAITENDPTKYQILCWNCNCATKHGKICPHKRKKVK